MLALRIQQYLRSVVTREREPIKIGALVLYVHPRDPHPYLNYAIPAPDAVRDDGSQLVDEARRRQLTPRLEYLETCFPELEASLQTGGFSREARLRLMTCTPDAIRAPTAAQEFNCLGPGSPLLEATLTLAKAAFNEGPPDEQELAAWNGNTIAALVEGNVVGSASWTTVIDGMSEIVGVAVAPNARRQGIGAALTIAAALAAFTEGASVALLTPGDHDTARVYERAGFRDTTSMLHLRHTE